MTFRVGQKVVCVDASSTDQLGETELFLGAIYTVRWVGLHSYDSEPLDLCVRLVGCRGGPDEWRPDLVDMPFLASRFRPIVARKTDISIFQRMLLPQGVEA